MRLPLAFLSLLPLFAPPVGAQEAAATRVERSLGDAKIPVTSSSPFSAPEANDARFTVDRGAGLDTGCTFESGGPLTFDIEITRHVGDVALLKEAGLIGETAKLLMPAFDVDFADGERDEVYINDNLVDETYLTGSNQTWKLNVFDIPIEWLVFPPDPGPGGTLTPEPNTIRIEIDVANPGEDVWCTAIDWAAIEIEVARPVVMAHGILSDGGVWTDVWVPGLDDLGLPNSNALNMGNLDSIQSNAGKIGAEVAASKARWGTEKIILVCHSKGGLDSRHYAESNDDIEKVVQIGTPNGGSPLADAVQAGSLKLTGLLATVVINVLAGPAGVQLTTPYMAVYNATHGSNAKTKYVALAGDYDPDCSLFSASFFQCALLNTLLLVTGRGDTIVPVTSVHALSYTQNFTYASSGLSDQSATHTQLEKSQSVFNILIGCIKEKKGPDDADSGPVVSEPAQMTVTEAGVIMQGEAQMFSFLVDDPGPASFTLMYPTGDLDMAILSPSGVMYDENTAFGDPALFYGEGEILGGFSESFDFNATEVGLWTVTVFGESVVEPSGLVGYVATVLLEDTDLELFGGFVEENVNLGDPLVVLGTLTDAGAPLLGATVEALVVLPDDTTTTVAMLDDGLGDDAAAGDGIYSGSLGVTTVSGTYRVAVSATDGATYERESLVLATASASVSTIPGPFSDIGEDTNLDGLFESLVVDVGLNISLAGTYRLAGELRDSLGNVLQATAEETLGAGPQTVSLRFDGATLFDNGVDGPYELVRVVLFEEEAIDILPVATATSAYTTSLYLANEFQHDPIIVPGTGMDFGVDTDVDNLFDTLHIDVDVLIEVPDTYEWTASLSTLDGIDIGFATGSAALVQGANTLGFDFNGSSIGSAGIDGPFLLRGLLIFGSSESLVQSEAYTTGSYFAWEFEGFPNTAPTFDGASPCGQSYVLFMGDSLSLDFSASDPDAGQTVTLDATGVPAGAAANPMLPQAGNPAATTLDWTPTPADEGNYVISFSATDNFPNPAQANCNITVDVSTNVAPEFLPVTPCGQVLSATVGEPFAFAVEVSDPNGGDNVTLSVSGLPGGAFMSPALPAVGNPVVAQFDWTPTCADVGSFDVTFDLIDDGDFPFAEQCTVTVDVGLPPTIPVLYVDSLAAGNGTGASWVDAFGDLQGALDEAGGCTSSPEVQIWVAAGTYVPTAATSGDPRTATFQLADGVGIYGGFVGGETNLEDRDPVANVTVLTADVNGDDLPGFVNTGDNRYHVVTGENVGATAVLDGFTLRGGTADGPFPADTNGGGITLENASPTLTGLIVESGLATRGGGLYADAGSAPVVTDSVFTGCFASKGGGAVFEGGMASFTNTVFSASEATIDGGGLLLRTGSSGTLNGCTFSGNTATTGGGLACEGSSVVAASCDFTGNGSVNAGGGYHNTAGSFADFTLCNFTSNSSERGGALFTDALTVDLDTCTFTTNSGLVDGGGLLIAGGATLTATDCDFDQNDAASLGGGALTEVQSQSSFVGCDFTANTAVRGGGLSSSDSAVEVTQCTFDGNSSTQAGGGIDDRNGNVSTVTASTFIGNTSANGGGAHLFGSGGSFTACTFNGNQATGTGGGLMLFTGSSPTVAGCNFVMNSASTAGGLYVSGSDPAVDGCTFELNSATVDAGGAACVLSSTVTFSDCTFDQNDSQGLGGGLLNTSSSSSTLTAPTFTANTAASGGGLFNDSSLSVSDGTFTGNQASSSGGAFDNRGAGAPTIERCGFSTNDAPSGGALFIANAGAPDVSDSVFDANTADNGAAVFNSASGAPSFRNCAFTLNTAVASGGVLFEQGAGATLMRGCLMSDNDAGGQGGCISIGFSGNLVLLNSTLASNTGQQGGGIFLAGTASIASSVLWGNADGTGFGETGQIRQPSGAMQTGFIDHSTVTGWTGALGGTGNDGLDPLFVDFAGGDFHLTLGSPAVDAGDPAFVADPGELDLDGEARVTGFGLDRGYDEAHDCDGTGQPDYLEILLGLTADCNGNGIPDACDISTGTSTDFDGNGVPDDCQVRQAPVASR
ncbi:MAG: choice-of-anchor X domain-containing protein [Planctomycetota bacterium]